MKLPSGPVAIETWRGGAGSAIQIAHPPNRNSTVNAGQNFFGNPLVEGQDYEVIAEGHVRVNGTRVSRPGRDMGALQFVRPERQLMALALQK